MSELDIDEEDEVASEQTVMSPKKAAKADTGQELDRGIDEDDEEDTASDSWSDDDSDDEDHALVRTVSVRDVEIKARASEENMTDYFQLEKPTVIEVGDVVEAEHKTDAIVVTVASAILTPPESPEEVVVSPAS